MDAIVPKFAPGLFEPPVPPEDSSHGAQSKDMSDKNQFGVTNVRAGLENDEIIHYRNKSKKR